MRVCALYISSADKVNRHTSDLLDGWQGQSRNLPPLQAKDRRGLLDQHLARGDDARVDRALLPLDVVDLGLDKGQGGGVILCDCDSGRLVRLALALPCRQLSLDLVNPGPSSGHTRLQGGHTCPELSPRELTGRVPLAPRGHVQHLRLERGLERMVVFDPVVSGASRAHVPLVDARLAVRWRLTAYARHVAWPMQCTMLSIGDGQRRAEGRRRGGADGEMT